MGCGTSTISPEETLRPSSKPSKPSAELTNGTSHSKRLSALNGHTVKLPKTTEPIRPSLQPRDSIYFTEDIFFDRAFIPELQITREGYFEQLEWKRPYMLVPEPEMFVAGSTPGDINQGLLGDCWFLSACAAVSIHDDMIARIIPPGQSLKGPSYTGLINFRF